MLSIRTILHPTDFSENASHALDFACGLAADYGASLIIIHVIAAPMALPQALDVAGARSKLDGLDIVEDGIEVTRRIEKGNPARQILSMARLCRADMIVMGSHHEPMGSVVDAVLRQATCPVLTVASKFGAGRRDEKTQVAALSC